MTKHPTQSPRRALHDLPDGVAIASVVFRWSSLICGLARVGVSRRFRSDHLQSLSQYLLALLQVLVKRGFVGVKSCDHFPLSAHSLDGFPQRLRLENQIE
jgi:hypothetical protein